MASDVDHRNLTLSVSEPDNRGSTPREIDYSARLAGCARRAHGQSPAARGSGHALRGLGAEGQPPAVASVW